MLLAFVVSINHHDIQILLSHTHFLESHCLRRTAYFMIWL